MPEKFLCPIPWVSLSLGAKNVPRLCCHQKSAGTVFANDLKQVMSLDHTKKTRETMLSGKIPSECASCFSLEKSGCRSPRLDYLERFNFHPNDPASIKYLDVTADNDCNLECIMCSPLYSKKLSHFFEMELGVPKESRWSTFLTIDEVTELSKTLEQLTITGGEPFFSKKCLEIIETLAQSTRSYNIILRIFTNLTHIPKSLIQTFERFKRVELILSIDSVEENYEIIRFPATWKKLSENLETLKSFGSKNLDLHLHSVLMATNWNSIGNLIRFFQREIPSHNILPLFIEIDSPQILHPRVLPEALYREGKEDIMKALETLIPLTPAHFEQILEFKRLIDKIESVNYSDKYVDYKIFIRKIENFRNKKFNHGRMESK